jgi:hypothetical protein
MGPQSADLGIRSSAAAAAAAAASGQNEKGKKEG